MNTPREFNLNQDTESLINEVIAFDDFDLDESSASNESQESAMKKEEEKYKVLATQVLHLHKNIKLSRKLSAHPILFPFNKRSDKQLFLFMMSLSRLSRVLSDFSEYINPERYTIDKFRVNGVNAAFNIENKVIKGVLSIHGNEHFRTLVIMLENSSLIDTIINNVSSYTHDDIDWLFLSVNNYCFNKKRLFIGKSKLEIHNNIPPELISLYLPKEELAFFNEKAIILRHLELIEKAKNSPKNNVKKTSKVTTGYSDTLIEYSKIINQKYCSVEQCFNFSTDILSSSFVESIINKYENDIMLGETDNIKNVTHSHIIENINTYLNLELKCVSNGYEDKFKEIEINFPNFIDVTKYIKIHCDFSIKKETPLDLPNILIYGPSGTGKTTYVRALSDAIGISNRMISVSSLTTSMEITGLGTVWGNAEPGILMDLFGQMKIGNPIIILDEMDKSVGTGGNTLSPDHALISLTEKETSRDMMLPFFKSEANVSHVNWIGTANELNDIKPILSDRFKSFFVPSPNKKEKHFILNNIYREILKNYNISDDFEDKIPVSITSEFGKSLRESKQVMETAIMKRFVNPMTINSKKIAINKSDISIKKEKREIF